MSTRVVCYYKQNTLSPRPLKTCKTKWIGFYYPPWLGQLVRHSSACDHGFQSCFGAQNVDLGMVSLRTVQANQIQVNSQPKKKFCGLCAPHKQCASHLVFCILLSLVIVWHSGRMWNPCMYIVAYYSSIHYIQVQSFAHF